MTLVTKGMDLVIKSSRATAESCRHGVSAMAMGQEDRVQRARLLRQHLVLAWRMAAGAKIVVGC